MIRIVAAVASLALVLSACGGGGSAPTGAGAVPGAVTVQGFAFKPGSLDVAVGSRVTWTNQDGAAHTTTSGKPGATDKMWDGQLGPSGGAFSFTFAKAGTYAYFCAIHGSSMTGVVNVK